MMTVIFRAAIICVVFLLCTVGTAYAQETDDPNGLQSGDIVFGIYPGDTAGDCCWLGARAAIRVMPPPDATALLINVFIPNFALKPQPQRLRVRIGAGPEQVTAPLSAGEHELVFTFHRHASTSSPLEVQLAPAYTFVPAQLGMNQDTRHLSILVRAVGFETPENGAGGAPLTHAAIIPRPITMALLLVAGVLIFMLTLRRPAYGLCAIILTDPFLLTLYVHGTTVTLPKVSLLAVALALVPRLAQLRSIKRDRTLQLLLAAESAFVLSMMLSSIHAHNHGAALRETLKAAQYAATLLVAYATYRLDPDERLVQSSLLVLAFAVLVPALAQERTGAPQAEIVLGKTIQRIAGPLDGPNQLAGFLGIVVPVLAAFSSLRHRLSAETLAITLGILACILTFSRGGMIGLIAALVFIGGVHVARAPRRAMAAVFGVYGLASIFAFLVFAGIAPPAVGAAFGAAGGHDVNGGLGTRADLWSGAYAMFAHHPLLGVGPGNFELTIGQYTPGLHTHANGMFFQTLAEQGIFGLLAFLAVTAASVGVFLRKLNNPFALGAAAASIALAFHQIVDCIVIYPKVGVIWWIILGVACASVAPSSQLYDTRGKASPGL